MNHLDIQPLNLWHIFCDFHWLAVDGAQIDIKFWRLAEKSLKNWWTVTETIQTKMDMYGMWLNHTNEDQSCSDGGLKLYRRWLETVWMMARLWLETKTYCNAAQNWKVGERIWSLSEANLRIKYERFLNASTRASIYIQFTRRELKTSMNFRICSRVWEFRRGGEDFEKDEVERIENFGITYN